MDHSTRRAKAPELLVTLQRRSGRGSLSAQLEHQLRDAVRVGRLRPGTPLPSTRALAAELGISRGLVVAAYAQLGAEGYLQLRPNAPPLVAAAIGLQASPRTVAADPLWRYNLRPDLPDYAAFPREEWLKSYRAALKRAPDSELGYGDVRGVTSLREGLVSYLGRVRGVVGDPEHTFVCGGFAQAIGLIGAVLARTGRGASASRTRATPSSAGSSSAAGSSRCRSRSTRRGSTWMLLRALRPRRCS